MLPIVKDFPRNKDGGFWHKEWLPEQMWLDGLYMAGPICAEYAKRFEKTEYLDKAAKGYEAVIRSLEFDGEDIQIGHVCIGTGVGDYQHYCDRPVSTNDLHGVGAFLIMCAETQKQSV